MFQMPSNGLSGHQSQNSHHQQQQTQPQQHQQQQQQTPPSNTYNLHALSQMPTTVVSTSHSTEMPHLLNTRKSK